QGFQLGLGGVERRLRGAEVLSGDRDVLRLAARAHRLEPVGGRVDRRLRTRDPGVAGGGAGAVGAPAGGVALDLRGVDRVLGGRDLDAGVAGRLRRLGGTQVRDLYVRPSDFELDAELAGFELGDDIALLDGLADLDVDGPDAAGGAEVGGLFTQGRDAAGALD